MDKGNNNQEMNFCGRFYQAVRRISFYNVMVITVIWLIIIECSISFSSFGWMSYFPSLSFSNLKSSNKTASQMTYTETQSQHPSTSITFTTAITDRSSTANIINSSFTSTISNVTFTSIISNVILSASVLCPLTSPKLEGPMKTTEDLFKIPPAMSILEAVLPHVLRGGRHQPLECVSRHKVAIIIPYRDREVHLRHFLNHMHPFLQRQQLNYGIFVIEQAGTDAFNRAMLMNIGFIESLKLYDWQCFVFHDVDLLPDNDFNFYSCPQEPRHMSVAVSTLNNTLWNETCFGGVSAFTKSQMMTINGFSNEFWTWNGKDHDILNRIKHHGFIMSQYPSEIARYTRLNHVEQVSNPVLYTRLYNGSSAFETDGLNSIKYILKYVDLNKLFTLVNVELQN